MFAPRARTQGTTAARPRKSARPRSRRTAHRPSERERRREPAEKDVFLDACSDTTCDEVGQLGRVVPDLRERTAVAGDRPCDDGLLHRDRCDDRGDRPRACLPPVRARQARPPVPGCEHDGAHRQMDLAGQWDRDERDRGPAEPSALEREQRRRQKEGDQAEEMPGGLTDAVGSDREHEPAGQRRGPGEPERAQPPAGDSARGDDGQQHDQVVGPDVAEEVAERPERDPEEPPLEVRRRLRLGPERVRVGPRGGAALDLVPGQPERPPELQVVAGGRLAVAGRRACEVVVVRPGARRAT